MAMTKTSLVYRSLIVLIAILTASTVAAQEDPVSEAIKYRIDAIWSTGELTIGLARIASAEVLPELYERNNFKQLWQNEKNVNELLREIRSSRDDGLDPEDYHLSDLLSYQLLIEEENTVNPQLLGDYDILLTDSLIRIGYHLGYGKVDPDALDSNWNLTGRLDDRDPVEAIDELIHQGNVGQRLQARRLDTPGYRRLKSALKKYREIMEAGGWEAIPPGPTLKPGMSDQRVRPLRQRLKSTGDYTLDLDSEYYDEDLKKAVEIFQTRHRLVADGKVGKQTVEILNIPVRKKIDTIRVNLERLRWVAGEQPGDYILVDIAGFRLYHMRDSIALWSTRVQVGKPYRKTPIFKSAIKYLVFNPTWTVPPTILRKDILPQVKKDPGYLDQKQMSVLDSKGREIDPATIDWSKYPGKPFPYILRQRPGENNALGQVKFIFPNKHFVYLHDTPSKSLFGRKDRAFSSGCIRVEDKINLAMILLDDPQQWSQKRIDEVIASRKTTTVFLPKEKTVYMLYWTVWFDDEERIVFNGDIYDRDNAILECLNEEFTFRKRPVAGRERI